MPATKKAATEKVSVTIDRAQLRWARSMSKRLGISVSSVLSDALRHYHEETAPELAVREPGRAPRVVALLRGSATMPAMSTDEIMALTRGD